MKRDDETFVPGNWQRVHVLPGERQDNAPLFRAIDGKPTADRLTEKQRRAVKTGWMHRRYLDNCGEGGGCALLSPGGQRSAVGRARDCRCLRRPGAQITKLITVRRQAAGLRGTR